MSAITETQVREAMSRVIDPELRKDLIELEMVRAITIDGGHVTVGVALTIPGCPLKATIDGDVQREVGSIEGVTSVLVDFTSMSEDERATLATRLRGGRPPAAAGTLSISPKTRVIAVASGKGGVGKSSMTVNLAIAFQQLGLEVGIIDADIYGFSVPGMLGIHQRPVTVDKMIVPPVAHNLKTISIGYFMEEGGAVLWRGPMLHKAMQQFLQDVHWGELDVLLIDMPPGTGDVAISLGSLLPKSEALVVTTPRPLLSAWPSVPPPSPSGSTCASSASSRTWRIASAPVVASATTCSGRVAASRLPATSTYHCLRRSHSSRRYVRVAIPVCPSCSVRQTLPPRSRFASSPRGCTECVRRIRSRGSRSH